MTLKISNYKTSLDHGNAYWMAKMSKAVYMARSETDSFPDEKGILNLLKQEDPGFISVQGVDKNTAQAVLIEHNDYFCMAFRGTDEIKDWLDNINAFSVKEIFGEFHRGFWQSVEDVWGKIFSSYRQLNQLHKRPLFLTGHSLGGAMATIAAARLINLDLPFVSVYTFGQPRALARSTARIFNVECKERFFRFHNNNDLVTRVPARFMGYSHVGSYLYISSEEKIYRESGFWFRFLDAFDGALEAVKQKGIDGIEDHSMDTYLAAIEAWKLRG